MKTARIATLLTTASLIATLAGCGAAAPGADMTLKSVKGTTTKAAAAKTATKAAAAVAPKGASAAVAASATRMAEIAQAGAGSVAVSLKGLGGQRKLMAVEDVATVNAVLTGANGAVQTRTVATTAPSLTFDGVAVGTASLTVTALDASGAVIGSGTTTTTVVAGQTAQAALTIAVSGGAVPASTTGNVNANVTFVNASAVPTALPSFLATPTPAPSASATPIATTGTRDVWGRIYNYAGGQQTTGSVRFTAVDGGSSFDYTATLRADGYYYVPGVPVGPTIQVTATSGAQTSTAYYLFENDAATTYDWLDLFVQDGVAATPTPSPSTGGWSNWFNW